MTEQPHIIDRACQILAAQLRERILQGLPLADAEAQVRLEHDGHHYLLHLFCLAPDAMGRFELIERRHPTPANDRAAAPTTPPADGDAA